MRSCLIVEIAGETAVTASSAWDCLRGQVLDSRFKVGDLLQLDRNGAWFRARDLVEAADVLLFLEREDQPGASDDFNRFREAAFLSHPNLVRVLAAGRLACGERNFIYMATETADWDLVEELQRRPMTVDEAADLLRQLASGLAYLHSENLTSCAVRAGAIWRVNGRWKLADFTELRVPGQYPVRNTRRLLLMPAFESPPEANQGIVSPAWDVWSVGSVVRKVFPRVGRSQPVPPPFDSIVSTALDPDHNARPSLKAMLHELLADRDTPPKAAPSDPPPPIPVSKPIAPPEPHELPRQPRAVTASLAPRNNRVPLIAGVVLAAAVAGILALALPIRMVHQQSVRTPEPPPAPVAAAPANEPPPQPAQPEPQEQTSQNPSGETNTVPPDGSRVQKDISTVLKRWVDAKRRRNLDEEIGCYAPFVDRFYGQRSLPADQLRREEQNVFSRIGTVQ
ncbi:MAG: serine/threonine protein kinase, partial [Bryobacterales bacterium]|nr:serine/threonine protein kinase [Bryobacterales bacterium]